MIGGLQKDTAALSEVSGGARSAKIAPPDGYMEQIELKDKPKRSLFRQATQFVRPRQQSTAIGGLSSSSSIVINSLEKFGGAISPGFV